MLFRYTVFIKYIGKCSYKSMTRYIFKQIINTNSIHYNPHNFPFII